MPLEFAFKRTPSTSQCLGVFFYLTRWFITMKTFAQTLHYAIQMLERSAPPSDSLPDAYAKHMRTVEELKDFQKQEADSYIRIKDGFINIHMKAWWRAENGPVLVNMNEHGNFENAKSHPHLYSFAQPKTKTVYVD